MQQPEQRILKKLAEAREAQTSAMSRFIQARARVMEVEARLQSMHTRLTIAHMPPDQPSEPTEPASSSGISKPDATPAAQVIIPSLNASYTPVQTNNREAATPPPDTTTSVYRDEDEEETQKMPALRPIRSALPTRRNLDAKELENATLSTLPKSERSDQRGADNETRETGTTDSAAKIPVIRQEHDQTQESL